MTIENNNIVPIKVITKQEFSLIIETTARNYGIGYLEAILHYCQEREIDPEDVAKLITNSLKEKLEAEAQSVNLLPKSSASLF